MHIKKLATRLIFAGGLGLLLGMFMDTTVAIEYGAMRVHNLHLQARQQNILLLSGVLFIGGIILLAAAKLKDTKEDEEAEAKALEDARATRKAALEASATRAREGFERTANTLWQRLPPGPWFAFDSLIHRVLAGLFVGLSLGLTAGAAGLPWWLIAGTSLLYAMRNIPARKAVQHLLLLHVVLLSVGCVFAIGGMAISPELRTLIPVIVIALVCPLLISTIWLLFIRRKGD